METVAIRSKATAEVRGEVQVVRLSQDFFPTPADTAAAAIPCVADCNASPGNDGNSESDGNGISRSGFFYVANTDSIVRYKYTPGDLEPQ